MTSTSNSGEIFSAANDSAFSDEKEKDQYTCQQRNVHFGFPSNLACRHGIWSHKSYVFLAWRIWLSCRLQAQCPLKVTQKSAAMLPMGLLSFQHFPCAVQSLSHGTKIVPNQHCNTCKWDFIIILILRMTTWHGTRDWFQIGKGVRQGCILSPCLFNLYAEYIMRNAGLEEAQAGIKIARRSISNLRYADETTLMAEREELKSLLMEVKVESEKVGLKLSIQKLRSWHLVPSLLGK